MTKAFPKLSDIHTIAFDFDGVFTDDMVWVDQEGKESVRCNRRDGLAFDFLRSYRKRGLFSADLFILSKEVNPVVIARARKLKIECHQGVGDKLKFMKDYFLRMFPELKNPFSGLVYLCNDLNDLPLMRQVGYSVVPTDAHPKVCDVADLVMPQRGGEGFVRAFVEHLLDINNLKKEELDGLISYC